MNPNNILGIILSLILLVVICFQLSKTDTGSTVEGLTQEADDETIKNRQAKDQYTKRMYNLLDSINNPTQETQKLTSALKSGLAHLHKINGNEKIEFVGDDLKKNYGVISGDPNTKRISIDSPVVNFADSDGKLTVNNKQLIHRTDDGLYLGDENTPVRNKKVCFIDNDGNETCVEKDTIDTLKRINSTSGEYDNLKSSVNTFLKDQKTFDNKVREVFFGSLDGYAKEQFIQDLQTLANNDIDISKISSLTTMVDGQGNLIGKGNISLKEGSHGQPKEVMSLNNDGNVSLGSGFSSANFNSPTTFEQDVNAQRGVFTDRINSTNNGASIQQANNEVSISGDKGVNLKTKDAKQSQLSIDNQNVYVGNQLCVGEPNDSVCLDEQTMQAMKSFVS